LATAKKAGARQGKAGARKQGNAGAKKKKFTRPLQRGTRLRRMTLGQAELWRTNPNLMAEASERLWHMQKQGKISSRQLYRILDTPLSTTRMIGKFRKFNAGQMSFKQLVKSINTAFQSKTVAKKKKVAKRPNRETRLRRMADRQARLWRTNPKAMAEASKRLWHMQKQGEISIKELYRILDTPLSITRMIGKFRSFNADKITFKQLMNSINTAFKNRVPDRMIKAALHAKPGDFGKEIHSIVRERAPPNSLVTSLTLKKLYSELRRKNVPPLHRFMLEQLRARANAIKEQIHEVSSNRYKAIGRVMAAEKKGKSPAKEDLHYAEWSKARVAELEVELISEVISKI